MTCVIYKYFLSLYLFVWSFYSKGHIIIALFSTWALHSLMCLSHACLHGDACLNTFCLLLRNHQFGPCFHLFELSRWLKDFKTNTENNRGPHFGTLLLSNDLTQYNCCIIVSVAVSNRGAWIIFIHFNTYIIHNCTVTLGFVLIWNLWIFWFKMCFGIISGFGIMAF